MKPISQLPSEAPLFTSAASAAAFALNFSGVNLQKSSVNRLIGSPSPEGRGLGGLDGAAQAGMIRAELAAIGFLGEAMIVADIASRTRPCLCKAPCCSGDVINPEWAAAINLLASVAKELKIAPAYMNVRILLLKRFFGLPLEITEIAKVCGVSRETASSHNSKLVQAFTALKKKAWADFDTQLQKTGMIERQEHS